jgi:hypothetical protein
MRRPARGAHLEVEGLDGRGLHESGSMPLQPFEYKNNLSTTVDNLVDKPVGKPMRKIVFNREGTPVGNSGANPLFSVSSSIEMSFLVLFIVFRKSVWKRRHEHIINHGR